MGDPIIQAALSVGLSINKVSRSRHLLGDTKFSIESVMRHYQDGLNFHELLELYPHMPKELAKKALDTCVRVHPDAVRDYLELCDQEWLKLAEV